jgi:hypothetical protein
LLTPEEQQELERCLKLYDRRILTEDEAVARLARIARRHSLDIILAGIPPALVGPLKNCIEAGPAVQPYSPASLPPVRSVDVVVLDSGAAVSRVSEFIHVAAVRSVCVAGQAAQAIASLWRQLPPDQQARCHIPPYGLRFHSDSGLICEASICWQCNNIYGQACGEGFVYEFDALANASRRMLAMLRETVGDRSDA